MEVYRSTAGLLFVFTTGDITRCYATGVRWIRSAAWRASSGAVVSPGYADSTVVKTMTTNLETSGGAGVLIGLLGDIPSSATLRDCYASGKVTSKLNTGGLVGIISGSSFIDRCYATVTVDSNGSPYVWRSGIAGRMYSKQPRSAGRCFSVPLPITAANGSRTVVRMPRYAWDGVSVNGKFLSRNASF